VLSALATEELAPTIRRLVLDRTSTLGVRQLTVGREVLDRTWVTVETAHGPVEVKVASRAGAVVHTTVEFDAAARLAASSGLPVREVLDAAMAAAAVAGLLPGTPTPER